MIQIPEQIRRQFNSALGAKNIPVNFHADYRKWLRYYLDFCHKYHFDAADRKSLPCFIKKLQQKKQNIQQQKQAHAAISLYYAVDFSSNTITKTASAPQSAPLPTKAEGPKAKNADWTPVFQKLKAEIKLRHYSPRTLKTYTGWARQFQAFTKSKDSRLLTSNDVKEFLTFLAVERKVSAAAQNQAFNALLFLFRHVLQTEFGEINDVPRAKKTRYIPVVLSRAEIDAIISNLSPPHDLIVKLLYGCGLRISECLSLRIHNINFDNLVVTVLGKGNKYRTVPLPETLVPELKKHLQSVVKLHENDLKTDFSGTFLDASLEKKYPNAAKELPWQWFFPAKTLSLVPEAGEYRRYHLHDTHVQKAIRRAVKKAQITKRASAHTFRHSFASHLLQANFDIRTIQELLGHSDVRTTMIYTHTIKSRTIKEAKSPLDF